MEDKNFLITYHHDKASDLALKRMKKCYVVTDTEPILSRSQSKTCAYYPENGRSPKDLAYFNRNGVKADVLITQSPFVISSFRRDEVFVQRGEDGEWVHPDFETYGTSIELIYERIFGVRNSIPKFIELEIEDVVRKATMSTSLPRMKDAKDVIYDRFGESIEKDMALAKLNRSIKDLSEFLKQQSSTE